MANSNQNNGFRTSELPLSAFLVTQGCKLVDIEKAGRQGIFVFNKDEIGGLPIKYISGEALVNPLDFNIAVRQLKKKLDGVLLTGGVR